MTKRLHDPKTSALRIKERRKELGMTQKDLSDKSGICLSAIKKYELGIRIPEGDYRQWLAQALDVYEDWIIGKSDFKDEKAVIDNFASTMKRKYSKDVDLFNSFNSFVNCLGYVVDYEEITITSGRKKKKISPATLNYLYWSVIKMTKEQFDNVDKLDGTIPENDEPYGIILKEGDDFE